jgi:hypothetical protein
MEAENRSALKEWAAVEDALAMGHLTVLVRKGGIYEKRGEFDVEHREFWIYPTGWHQNESELRREIVEHLGDVPRFAPDEIPFRLYCVVEDALRVESVDALLRLREVQPFTDDTLRSRFEYRGKPYLHVLIVRAFRLPEPVVVRNTPAYEGCVSWVELDEALSTAGAQPVMMDAQFARARREVLARLGEDGVVRI